MSDPKGTPIETVDLPSSSSLIGTLGGIAILSGILVVLTFQLTFERIEQNKRAALEKAVYSVLPGAVARANYALDETGLHKLDDADIAGANVFAGYDESGARIGFAIEASARGYQDVVRVLYGYNPETEKIIGFTVLQSNETPGLGDKIAKDGHFLANFNALDARLSADRKNMANEIVTVKNGTKTEPWQIDAISGATVSSAAVGKALRESTAETLPLLFRFTRDGL